MSRPSRPAHGHGPHGMPGVKAIDFNGSVKKLMAYIADFKKSLLLVIIFAVCSTVFSIIGPKVLGNVTTEIFNGLVGKLSGGAGINFGKVGMILALLLLIYAVSSVFNFLQGYIMTGVTQKITYKLRNEITEKIGRVPLKYFESSSHGDLLSRVTNDVDMMSHGMQQSITQVVTSVATLVGVLIMMLSISWQMTLVTLLILPISLGFVGSIVKKSQKYFKQQQELLGKVNGCVEETYGGHNVVKLFNAENRVVKDFTIENDRLYSTSCMAHFFGGIMMPIMTFVGNIGYVGIAILGGFYAIRQVIAVGEIQSFFQYIRNFTQPINQVAQIMNQLQSTVAAAERVFAFLEQPEEVAAPENPVKVDGLSAEVTFEHVRFGYDPDVPVIKDFSVSVKSGQKIAIVGPTGSGKTTLVKLLMRFYDVDSGSIRVGGHDIRDFDRHELRDMFSMVLQDAWLFSGSIRDNIRYGKPDATDEEVEQAAKAAFVHHYIRTLNGGYEMELNEETTNISQGQKQLLTIARAILADPKILILDEATSSVDTRTEERIQMAMDHLMQGRTSFIIAHRLSTIRNADMILVMRDGDIIEQGNHEELLSRNGFYAELYNAQFEKTDVA